MSHVGSKNLKKL